MRRLSLLISMLAGSALAGPTITAQSILVNPTPGNLNVDVWTGKDPTGRTVPTYCPGERLSVAVRTNQNAHVYLFNLQPDGAVNLILPNRYTRGTALLKANTTTTLPAPGDAFTFDVAPRYGRSRILALASAAPLNLEQLARFETVSAPFASLTVNAQGLGMALSVVLRPLGAQSWVTDMTEYAVANCAAAPAPKPPVVAPAPRPAARLIDERLQVQPVAGARAVRVKGDDDTQELTFDVNGTLRDVFAQYQAALLGLGFQVREYKDSGDKIEGEFRNGRREVKLEVKQKGQRFELKFEHKSEDD